MSRFRWFKRHVETKSVSETSGIANPETFHFDLFGSMPLASGVSVNPTTAMQCSPVRCAVAAISEAVAQLPVHLYERGENGSRERAPDHPIAPLLKDAANEFTSSAALIERVTADALLHRNGGISEIVRVEGRPVELHRIDPATVTVETDAYNRPLYRLSGPNRQRVLSHEDVIHIAAPTGCPTHHAREAIGLALVLEQHAARLFGSGARPSGILSVEGQQTPEALKLLKAAWQAAHGGSRSGGTAVLPGAVKYDQVTLSPVDNQFLELRKFAIDEIARVYRVPPILLMEYGRATFDNSEEMGRQFVTYALMPWIKRWEAEIRIKLIPAEDRDSIFAEFLTDDLLRADLEKRAEAYSKLIAARVLNPNEVRALENRPPYVGGDVYSNPNTSTGGTADI